MSGSTWKRISGDELISGRDGSRDTHSDVWNDVVELDPERRDWLHTQTSEVLQAHAEIQREHRVQAMQLLRAYVARLGVLATVIALVTTTDFLSGTDRFLIGLQDTEPELTTFATPGAVSQFVGIAGFVVTFLRIVGLPEPILNVVKPKQRRSNALTRMIPFYSGVVGSVTLPTPTSGQAGTVYRVLDADDLRQAAAYPKRSEDRLLALSIRQAQRNETVINYNMEQLEGIYDIILRSIRDALVFGTLVFVPYLLFVV